MYGARQTKNGKTYLSNDTRDKNLIKILTRRTLIQQYLSAGVRTPHRLGSPLSARGRRTQGSGMETGNDSSWRPWRIFKLRMWLWLTNRDGSQSLFQPGDAARNIIDSGFPHPRRTRFLGWVRACMSAASTWCTRAFLVTADFAPTTCGTGTFCCCT